MPSDKTGDSAGDQDPLRRWREMSRSLIEGGELATPLRERCEALFAAWGRFARTWAEAGRGARTRGQPGGPFDPAGWMDAGGAAGWGDLWRWFGAVDDADPWQAEREAIRMSAEWRAYAAALERYNAVMAAAWLKAFGRFAERVAGRMGEAPQDWVAMQAEWQAAADAELAAAQGSEAFLDAQRELIRARLACAALLRSRLAGLADLLGLPGRDELDALHETVHRMGRELRELRARIDALDDARRGSAP